MVTYWPRVTQVGRLRTEKIAQHCFAEARDLHGMVVSTDSLQKELGPGYIILMRTRESERPAPE